ncbi:MAG: hypothetical protein AAF368_20285, partial [Planctomycetota bacterium]
MPLALLLRQQAFFLSLQRRDLRSQLLELADVYLRCGLGGHFAPLQVRLRAVQFPLQQQITFTAIFGTVQRAAQIATRLPFPVAAPRRRGIEVLFPRFWAPGPSSPLRGLGAELRAHVVGGAAW